MIRVSLSDPKDKRSPSYRDFWSDTSPVDVNERVPVFVPVTAIHGVFKSATRTSQGTTVITTPLVPGGSLLITDLIINAGKFSDGETTVRFTDGSNTIDIVVMDNTDSPLSLGISFAGKWVGWQDARLELVTVNDVSVTAAVGYTKMPNGLPFAEWDALR